MEQTREASFSLGPDELTDLGRQLLENKSRAMQKEAHLCVEKYMFGRHDGRALEVSLMGLEEVEQKDLREGLRNSGVSYWEVDPSITAKANIIRPINILKQGSELSEDVETGLRTWPIAHFMAEMFAQHPSMIPEGPVLELGAGLGMLGCVLRQALTWPHPVVLTDIQTQEFPHVLNFLKANVNLNTRPGQPFVAEDLFWGASHIKPFKAKLLQAHGIDIDTLGGFTCIIGCDLVYHEFAPELLESIDLLLSHSSEAVAYISYPYRGKEAAERFTRKLESMHFHVKELSFVEGCTSSDKVGSSLPVGSKVGSLTCSIARNASGKILSSSGIAQALINIQDRRRYLKRLVSQLGLNLLAIRRSSSESKE